MNIIRVLTKPAKLPTHLENRMLIKNIPVGGYAYTVPWAMWVNSDRECYLNGNYDALNSPGGTGKMLISHTITGFYVEIPLGEVFDIDENIPWYGASEDCLIPVAGFINEGEQS